MSECLQGGTAWNSHSTIYEPTNSFRWNTKVYIKKNFFGIYKQTYKVTVLEQMWLSDDGEQMWKSLESVETFINEDEL